MGLTYCLFVTCSLKQKQTNRKTFRLAEKQGQGHWPTAFKGERSELVIDDGKKKISRHLCSRLPLEFYFSKGKVWKKWPSRDNGKVADRQPSEVKARESRRGIWRAFTVPTLVRIRSLATGAKYGSLADESDCWFNLIGAPAPTDVWLNFPCYVLGFVLSRT